MANITGTDEADLRRGTELADIIRALDGDDTIYGRGGTDTLWGEDDNDSVYSGSGNDVLAGGVGNDINHGGEGSDRFVFLSGRDTILNFKQGDDDIDLTALVSVNSFAQAMARATHVDDDTVMFRFVEGQLTVHGINRSDLVSDDFLF